MENNKKKIGRIGEDEAEKYLLKNGFDIIERNNYQKWGEIDIIAKKKNVWRFVEVKTMRINPMFGSGGIVPEDQITRDKIIKIKRSAVAYANRNRIDNYQIDLIAIDIGNNNEIFDIRHWENI